jgi:hypothetical protein
MSFLAHVLVIMVIAGGMLLVAGAAMYFVARRFIRRRWHGVRTHVATRGALAAFSLFAAWRERVAARRTPEELSQGTAARARRKMWISIEDAEAAVHHADSIDAPVADLPAVCSSLRAVGSELDQILRLERRLPPAQDRPDTARMQVAEVIRAARDVQRAALQASSDAQEPQLRALARDARDEVEIVAAALSRLRSITSRQP